MMQPQKHTSDFKQREEQIWRTARWIAFGCSVLGGANTLLSLAERFKPQLRELDVFLHQSLHIHPTIPVALAASLTVGLILLTIFDLREGETPWLLSLIWTGFGCIVALLCLNDPVELRRSLIGVFMVGAPMVLIHWKNPNELSRGAAITCAGIAAHLGYYLAFVAICLASVLAVFVSVMIYTRYRLRGIKLTDFRSRKIVLAPFLTIGALIRYFWPIRPGEKQELVTSIILSIYLMLVAWLYPRFSR